MAGILQAGPYITQAGDALVVEGDPTLSGAPVPVNCAMDTGSAWRWKMLVRRVNKGTNEQQEVATFPAVVTDSEAEAGGDLSKADLRILFAYQAATATSVSITYSAVHTGDTTSDSHSFSCAGNTISGSGSGSTSLALPVAEFPKIVTLVITSSARASGGSSAGVSLTIS